MFVYIYKFRNSVYDTTIDVTRSLLDRAPDTNRYVERFVVPPVLKKIAASR